MFLKVGEEDRIEGQRDSEGSLGKGLNLPLVVS